MMSLIKPSLAQIVKRLYVYKLKAYLGSLATLLILQLLAILFSRGMVASSTSGMNDLYINVAFYSADLVLVFTFVWAFITSLLITTKVNRFPDFTFVTNRLSSNLANIFYIFTVSMLAGSSAMLCSHLVKMSIHFFSSRQVIGSQLALPFPELLLGVVATSLYVLLFGAVGYFIGMLVQMHPLLPLFLGGSFLALFVGAGIGTDLLENIYEFFFYEASLLIFAGKVSISVVLLFLGATLLSSRMEVRS